MNELAVTAVGADRPGIVAAVTRVLTDRGGNLEDSAMTILGGHFAIMLLVATDDDPESLRTALAEETAEFALTLSVSPAVGGRTQTVPTHLLSVYGADRPGIVAGVSEAVAAVGANVCDLETQVIGAENDPVYAMVMELAAVDAEALTSQLNDICGQLGVDHTLRTIEAETY